MRPCAMTWNHAERLALADALEYAGPGAPTLCEGWSTEHLAAHVVLRESAPLVGAGIVVPVLTERTERLTRALGERSTAPADYAALVERVRQGPPRWHPLSLVGDPAQLAEMFVHTEDVRRGAADGRSVPPRAHPSGLDDALWRTLRRMRRGLYRDVPHPVVLQGGTGRELVLGRRGSNRPGGARVTVVGPVGELVLHAFGRTRVAHVEIRGTSPDVVAAFERTHPR